MAGALTVSFLSFLIAGIGAAGLLKDLKKRQNFTFLPFGPALVFGGFVIVFWGEKVVNYCIGLF
jgi:prepilin signal peptidase PulO-like enzyme (type II secretory pathway)